MPLKKIIELSFSMALIAEYKHIKWEKQLYLILLSNKKIRQHLSFTITSLSIKYFFYHELKNRLVNTRIRKHVYIYKSDIHFSKHTEKKLLNANTKDDCKCNPCVQRSIIVLKNIMINLYKLFKFFISWPLHTNL